MNASKSGGWVVSAAFVVALVMIAQQLAGKAIRDAFFLGAFDAEFLPTVMTTASILSVVSVLAVARLYQALSPMRLVPAFFFVSGAWFALEWSIGERLPRVAAVSVYIHTTSFGAVAISGFWSVLSERFDPYTVKRVIAQVAAGATLGGVVGGIAAWRGAASLSITTMLLALCGANVFCGVLLAAVARGATLAEPRASKGGPAWTVFEETPYLARLGVLVGLLALGTAGIDYVFKATAAASFSTSEGLISFFAKFYLAVGVLTFVLQTVVGRQIVRRAGLAGSIATLPGAIVVLGGLAVLFPELLVLAVLRGGAATVESSLYRSGYELLYAPLTPQKKRAAKTLIDVGADKLGGALGGALAVFVVGLIPGLANYFLLSMGVACALGGLWLTRQLARGYVSELEDRLTDVPEPDEEVSGQQPDRPNLVVGHTPLRLPVAQRPEPPLVEDRLSDVVRGLEAFAQRDRAGIEWALRQRTDAMPAVWVSALVPLLDEAAVGEAVALKLSTLAPRHIGLLTDAALNRSHPVRVRSRTVEIIGRVGTQRSAYGLLAVLETEPFEIRYRAAVALSTLKHTNPDVEVSESVIYRVGMQAVDRARINFFGSGTAKEGELTHAGTEAGRGVAFCVRLLSVILPPQPLLRALDALGDEDARRRGTGLEYFENVLPPDVQAKLLPFFSNDAIAKYARRDAADILREIAQEEPDVDRALADLLHKTRRRHSQRA